MDKDVVTTSYIDYLINRIIDKIESDLNGKSATFLFNEHFRKRIDEEKNTRNQFIEFQKYYFATLKNIDEIDFKVFKQRYSLQGVNRAFLESLNESKIEIKNLIESDKLAQLYFKFFESAEIETKNGISVKTLGSFFTKLVHTLIPDEYTPVDIPMKNYFEVDKDSYYIAMIAISKAFKIWCDNNSKVVFEFKNLICKYFKEELSININKDVITDMKVMNTIFWSIANPNKTSQ